MICSIVGGGCGVVFGGIFSDILVKRMGIRQVHIWWNEMRTKENKCQWNAQSNVLHE